MRITIDLDPNAEELLGDATRGRLQGRERTIGQATRAGLGQGTDLSAIDERFVIRAQPMGLRAGIHPQRLSQLADELEAEIYSSTEQPLP